MTVSNNHAEGVKQSSTLVVVQTIKTIKQHTYVL